VPFCSDGDPGRYALEFKESDQIVGYELGCDRTTDHGGKLRGTHSDILLDLDDTHMVASALCLNRNDLVSAAAVYANVDLVGFDLSEPSHGCTQVTLKRVAGHAGKHID